MNVLNHLLTSLLQASWQAGVLVLVVLLVQALCGKRLAPRWRHALWILVLLRLALPSTIESRWSLFAWLPSLPKERRMPNDRMTLNSESVSMAPSLSPSASSWPTSLASPSAAEAMEAPAVSPVLVRRVEAISYPEVAPAPGPAGRLSTWDWLGLLWLVGAGILAGCVLVPSIRFHGRVSRLSPMSDPELTELLDSCRLRMRVRCRLQIYETDLISSPGLFGLLRPQLLVPIGVRDRFRVKQFEHIILHELAHLKRRDLIINGAMTVLWVVHWFNPLVWLAMARIRVDRELACDALALSHMEQYETKSYGETIIRLVEDCSNRGVVAGLIGMREDPGALRQRIRMIARFRRPGRWSALGMGLVLAVGVVSLTDAQLSQIPVPVKKVTMTEPPSAPQTTDSKSVPNLPWAWQVTGQVTDATTRQPIPKFRITVGEFPDLKWEDSKVIEDPHGRFSVSVRTDTRRPGIRIEAEGYLLGGEPILPEDHPRLDVKLTKGDGPRGTLLLPDGKPAVGIRVALVPAGFDLVTAERAGWNDSHPDRYWTKLTEADGTFSFWPSWNLTQVLVSSKVGWALVSAERLRSQPIIRLEPFARLRGTLRRGGQAVTQAELHLSSAASSEVCVSLPWKTVTDSSGRFEFDTLPPGTFRIGLRETNGLPILFGSHPMVPLTEIVVHPGQEVVLDLEAPDLRLVPPQKDLQRLPPVRVPGVDLTGIVNSPSGAPASGVEVAVTLPERPVVLGRGQLADFDYEPGQSTRTDAGGRFRLPLFEGAGLLIALSDAGIARMTVEAFRASPTLRLEPWAEIRGTFRIGANPAQNATLRLMVGSDHSFQREGLLSTLREYNPWHRPSNNHDVHLGGADYTFHTDDEGRYRMLYVPPGLVDIRHEMNVSPGTDWLRELTQVRAEGGKVTQLDLGGRERKIRGKLAFPRERPPLLRQSFSGFLETEELLAFRKRLEALPSPEEQLRFADSKQAAEVLARSRSLMVLVALDGTIQSGLVVPGRYGVRIDSRRGLLGLCWSIDSVPPPFISEVTFEVPEAKPGKEDQVVELGTIQLQEVRLPNR